MRLALVTDAWFPQVNGVVRTLSRTREELLALGHEIEVISPDRFHTVPCPTYPEIRLAVLPNRAVGRMLEACAPQAIHIATEGPLGWAARGWCLKKGLPFTTSYHTRFPEYVSARVPVPTSWGYAIVRKFHGRSAGVMVATPGLKAELESRGFTNIRLWSRGVDTELFRPRNDPALDLPKPVYLYCGRVAVEKNIEAFLKLDLPIGTKLVVGDGPMRADLQKRYPDAVFAGAKHGDELSRHYASADVFVFPSKTDTFGLVMLEAAASGLPIAAFPVPGPLDVVDGHGIGVLDDDLSYAVDRALAIPPERCRSHALKHSWKACAELFFENLQPFG